MRMSAAADRVSPATAVSSEFLGKSVPCALLRTGAAEAAQAESSARRNGERQLTAMRSSVLSLIFRDKQFMELLWLADDNRVLRLQKRGSPTLG